jgi:DNA polymerase III subunit delta
MKVDARRVSAFLGDPGRCRVVLLYGDDVGLIRERGDFLVRTIAGSAQDPFRTAELDRGSLPELPAEASALSLSGGRRVVRVRDVTDAAVPAVRDVLAGPGEAFVVLEAPDLPSRSRLRSLVESAADAAALGCYPDEGSGLEDTIRSTLGEHGVKADTEAVGWLASQLGADRATTRQELGKLATYAGRGGRVDLAAAMACIGDMAGLSLDDALFAATAGDLATTDRALELAIAEGATAVGVLRAGLLHLQRLHRMRLAIDAGLSVSEAMKAARPPVFFRRTEAVRRALTLWHAPGLRRRAGVFADAERNSKHTGAPAETICREAILGLARDAVAPR